MTQAHAALEQFPAADTRRMRAVLIGSAGNLIEWYDIYAYSAFSLYFAGAFFPQTDPVAPQLAAASLFAAAFFVRPLGGALFGYLAERRGRRNALTGSVLLMCFGSLLIAATPTYATVGFAAPVILAIARLRQSLSQGGEYGSGATYLSEVAHPNRRGFYSGVWYVTLIGGQLWAIVSGYTSIAAIVKAELFPTAIRAMGVGVPYGLTVAIFGGSVDWVALNFKNAGFEGGFFWSATACIFISLICYIFMRDMKTHSKMEQAL